MKQIVTMLLAVILWQGEIPIQPSLYSFDELKVYRLVRGDKDQFIIEREKRIVDALGQSTEVWEPVDDDSCDHIRAEVLDKTVRMLLGKQVETSHDMTTPAGTK